MRRLMRILETPRWMYHRTTADRIDTIKKAGLRINQSVGLTLSGDWAEEVYGCRPIFLSASQDAHWAEHAPVVIQVITSGLTVVADLPSLVDHDAYYDIDEWLIWWDHKSTPPAGLPAEISMDDLLTPGSSVVDAAVEATQSAACLEDIPPDRLRLILQ